MHTVVLQVFTILQARFYSYSEKCVTPVSVTYWSFSAILKWGEVTPRWIFLVHWAPAERRGRPIKCHGDSIQQHVLWDVSASFSVSQVMKRVPGDVTHQLAAVTAPLWVLQFGPSGESYNHTHKYTLCHLISITGENPSVKVQCVKLIFSGIPRLGLLYGSGSGSSFYWLSLKLSFIKSTSLQLLQCGLCRCIVNYCC